MHRTRLARVAVVCAVLSATTAFAINQSIPRVNGDDSRALLGNGTGIIVGIIDSGIDDTHPGLSGRMVAEANFVPTEPGNTGDDVVGHGTAVAGVLLGADATFQGMAPGARYLNARVIDSNNTFASGDWVVNGAGWAVSHGANVLNMSLNYFNTAQDGSSKLSMMSDFIVNQLHIPVVICADNNGNNSPSGTPNQKPQGPAEAYNVFSAAATQRTGNYNKIATFSSWGGSSDGRNKPDIAGPGEITTYNANWETQADFNNWTGTSFAAPHVAGLLAQEIQYGRANGLSQDPLVLKATVLNSAEKVNNRNGGAWAAKASSTVSGVFTATSPLDDYSGSGQIDGLKLYSQYSAGAHAPGSVPVVGWDLHTVTGVSSVDYSLGELVIGSRIEATLAWNRHVGRNDAGTPGVIEAADSYFVQETVDNLDLQLFRDGNAIAQSISSIDNLEQFGITITDPGQYFLRVSRLNVAGSGTGETYGLAWSGVAVPEPSLGAILILVGAWIFRRARV